MPPFNISLSAFNVAVIGLGLNIGAYGAEVFFFFKQKTAYEIDMGLEFRRVLFRSDMRSWVGGRRPRLERGLVYVSIDLDAFDPGAAPGVSHREPGGLSVRDVLGVLHELTVPIVGADVVEFNPAQDPTGLTAAVCAKLVKELAGKMIAG